MSKKIKVCHVIGDFVNGGVESVIYNYFSHMNLDDFEVHIIGHGIKVQACADRFVSMGFRIHNITPKRESLLRNMKEMEAIFRENDFDVVHSHLTEWACIPMYVAWKCGIKTRVNHSHMAEQPRGIKNKVYYGIRLKLGKLFATDHFACGRDAAVYLFGDKAVEAGKVTILSNAIDLETFKFDDDIRQRIRRENRIADSTTVVGHVGRFFEQKNHSFLIDIFDAYQKTNPNSLLLLFGDGELKEKIEKKVHQLKLDKAVKFMGVKSNINEWYQAMDLFLLPSLFEGLPVVGVEAQASGLPCVFSDAITSEIKISDHVTFVPLAYSADEWADTIKKLIAETIRNKVELSSRYDITKCANKLEQFYHSKVNFLSKN